MGTGHLKEIVPALIKPSKKLDKDYSGQYDFVLPFNKKQIKIEVKASRAVEFRKDEPLYVKALSIKSKKPFDMNFQQVKPKCCEVFVWVAVWRDVIKYWVLPSSVVEKNKYYSKGQHRGNKGEGQLHLNQDNMKEFINYEFKSTELEKAIQDAYIKQTGQ
ncbi:MAG: hypothetical protein ABH823_02680 [bacterium]